MDNNKDLLMANLNLYAVLPRLQQIVENDEEAKEVCKDWKVTIQFSVANGPILQLQFKDGKCIPYRGKVVNPSTNLYFTNAQKLNRMFGGENITPLPIKGILKALKYGKELPKLTDRLEYYLRPTEEALKDEKIFDVNLECTLYTAVAALKEVSEYDVKGKAAASKIPDGTALLKILPDGPAAHISIKDHVITPGIGEIDNPTATMTFRDKQVAYDLLNGKIDSFAAVGLCDVKIRGLVPIVEAINPILDQVGKYLA